MKRALSSLLGLGLTIACLATAQVNLGLALVFCLIGMFFLLRG